MGYTNWVQSNFAQRNFYEKLVTGIKLIFKAPNDKPFKKSSLIMELRRSRVDINTLKHVRCNIILINIDNNIR